MKNTVFIILLILSSCSSAEIVSQSGDTYTVKYIFDAMTSPAMQETNLREVADAKCSKGWKKLNEKPIDEGAWGGREWNIKCINGAGN